MEKKKERLKELEGISQRQNFWQEKEKAKKIIKELGDLKEEISSIENLEVVLDEIKELAEIGASDDSFAEEIKKKSLSLLENIKEKEKLFFLSGEYDQGNAILEIFAGAGGVDAQDWATILLRMFQRYCLSKGFQVKIIHQSFGDGVGPEGRIGTKSACLEIRGKYAYGFLKNEAGVHRLVRQSPFSSKNLRHTSFVLVNVLPEISSEDKKIEIRDEDIKIDFFRASGPGGQYVNKRESAVRITHLPTKITVTSQSERLQGLNKENALKVLRAKLYFLEREKEKEKVKEIKGGLSSASWGNQIRSYILYPYKLIKDLRTGVETTETEKILDGDLEEFIKAEIML